MFYQTLLKEGQQRLEKYNLDIDLALYLINYYLKLIEIDKLNNIKLTNKEVKKYNQAITKIIKGKAPQYIIGEVNFYGYQFKINKHVLIPRFETEELVFYTLYYLKQLKNNKPKIIDIGTGSGVIGITLKKEIPQVEVTLTDISRKALLLAKNNAKRLKTKVTIIKSNLFEKINDKYDLLISNPPYLKNKKQALDLIVKNNEPHLALYGGNDGLKYYKVILKEAKRCLKKYFLIALEIDESLVDKLRILIRKYFVKNKYVFKKDNQGRMRMLFIFNFND